MVTNIDTRGEEPPRSSIDKAPILSTDCAFDRLPDEIIEQYDPLLLLIGPVVY